MNVHYESYTRVHRNTTGGVLTGSMRQYIRLFKNPGYHASIYTLNMWNLVKPLFLSFYVCFLMLYVFPVVFCFFFHKKQITKMNLNFFFWAHKILELPNDLKSENTWIFFFRYCFVSFNLTIMNQCHISGVVVAVCLCVLLQTASASLYYTGYSPALYGWNQPSTDFFGNFSGGGLVMPIFRKSSISFAQINTMIVWFLFLASLMPFLCNCHGVRSVTFRNCFY